MKFKMRSKEIKNIYIHLTKGCNLKCSYCYFDANKQLNDELLRKELWSLFEDIATLNPEKVIFTGGEPLTRIDVFDIAADFRNIAGCREIKLCLMSNGTLIDRMTAKSIASAFDEVRLSLDGITQINDLLRGEGTFKLVSSALRLLSLAGMPAGISITATSLNINDMESFLEYLFDTLYVSDIHVSPFRPVGRAAGHPELNCSWQEVKEKTMSFWNKRFGSKSAVEDSTDSTLIGCGSCGIGSHINILPDASVYPCHVLSVPEFLIGNVRKKRLTLILKDSNILSRMKNLDVRNYKLNSYVENLVRNAICLGEVYRDCPDEIRKMLIGTVGHH